MTSIFLKGCPHCEGQVAFHKDDEPGGCDGCHLIECKSCNAFFDYSVGADPLNSCEGLDDLREACAALFNRRPE